MTPLPVRVMVLDTWEEFPVPADGALAVSALKADVLKRARKAGVKIVNGTDGVAGAHGRKAEEFIYRVRDGGDKPMDAITSATSVSAQSMRLGDRLGSLAVGMEAACPLPEVSGQSGLVNRRRNV